MPDHADKSIGSTDEPNEPVDVALEIALRCARDDRVRELIRESMQHRQRVVADATDSEVSAAIPETLSACGGGE